MLATTRHHLASGGSLYEENGVGSSDAFVGGSTLPFMSEHAEVVCHAAELPFTVWPFDKEAMVHGLPCSFVNDSVTLE
jgi:hypothetical protein